MSIAVFAVDPGGATGVAWGIFDPAAEIGESLRGRLNSGSATVEGDVHAQIRAITYHWRIFSRGHAAKAESLWFVCEDFIYTGTNTYSGDSASISTALIWGVEGYRMGQDDAKRGPKKSMPPLILQTASQAKGFCTKQRLKDWEIWVVGREHERSAWQHVAYFLKHYQVQHGL